MKTTDYLVIAIVALIVFHFLFPKIETVVETEYIPGDTVVVTNVVSTVDTVIQYKYHTNIDTVKLTDTVYVVYSTDFNLGTDTLGTSGNVSFDMNEFKFKNIEYRYPNTIKTVTDTLKQTKIENPIFLENTWFWTTLATLALLVLSVGG